MHASMKAIHARKSTDALDTGFSLSMNIDASIFLARLWGSFFLVFGGLFVLTGFLGRVIEMTEEKSFVVSTGYLTLLMGLVTVILHNSWALDWRLAITILGWSTVIKGIIKIAFPDYIHRKSQAFRKRPAIEGSLLILLGGWLFWMSL